MEHEDGSEEENGELPIERPVFRDGMSYDEKRTQFNALPQSFRDAYVYENYLRKLYGLEQDRFEFICGVQAAGCFKPEAEYFDFREYYMRVLKDYELIYFLARSELRLERH